MSLLNSIYIKEHNKQIDSDSKDGPMQKYYGTDESEC